MQALIPAVPAQFAHLLKPLRAAAPVVQPRDKRPQFEPQQGAKDRGSFVEMPELETHECPSIGSNDTDHLCFAQAL